MRVFLAGATGVIGSSLVPQLLHAGHEVSAMTRSVLRAAQLDAAGADPVVCDLFDADVVRAVMADTSPDAVIHQVTALPARLDWGNPNLFDENNRVRTEGTRVLVDAALAAGARRVVAQSIAFVYAPTGDRVKDEDAPLFVDAPPPVGGLVAAIVEHEQRVTGTAGIEGLVLRYGMLYGPGTYHDRRGSTGADIIAGRVPLIQGATGMYSWLHVEDAASAAVAALERGAPGTYNVVDDEPAPQTEWLPVLARALHADPPPAAERPPPPDTPEMSLRGASNAKAKRELGWRPRYGSWRAGFAASLARPPASRAR
jgi:nucleoside-diphosphate-sugar epimerase